MISFKGNIDDNKKKLVEIVDEYFDGDQHDNIMSLIDHFNDRMDNAPASGRPNYHNCFRGGWLDHTLRVIQTSLDMKNQFIKLGVKVDNSDSEVVLAAMFHDLGKLGDLDESYYLTQTDEWRRNKLNEWYTYNDKLEPMSVTDRSLWLLQHFNIDVSPEVWKAIKMSDGLFDKGNEDLYRKSTDSRNILHYIVHFGDWTSTIGEKQLYLQSLDVDEVEVVNDDTPVKNKKELDELKNTFNSLFENS